MHRLLVSSLLLCLAPVMATAAPSASAPAAVVHPCEDASSSPELQGSLCTVVQVPLHHAAAGGPSISLFLRRIPAEASTTRRGEVWLLSGGPGESGASLYPLIVTYQKALPGYDLVIPDHRGTGRSARICPVQEAPDSANGTGLAGAEWGPCIGAMYADMARTTAFSITEAAQDVSWLLTRYRCEGEVILYGVSYGTQLALRTLQVSPVPLDGMILDGLVPREDTQAWDLSRRTALVDAVGRQVLGAEGIAHYRGVLQASETASWKAAVPGGDLRRFLGALLNFPALRDRIPGIVDDLAHDDAFSLRQAVADHSTALRQMGQGGNNQPSLPLVMLIATSENNARPGLSKAVVDAEAKDALFVSPIPGLLVDSPVPTYAKDTAFGKRPAALPRTLVMQGTLDPNTSYEGARDHAERLSRVGSVRFHTVERGAHLLAFTAPQCFAAATAAFLGHSDVAGACTEPTQR